jgi:hypothetical protein
MHDRRIVKNWPDDMGLCAPAGVGIYQEDGGSLAGKLSSMVTSCALSVRSFVVSAWFLDHKAQPANGSARPIKKYAKCKALSRLSDMYSS